MEVNTLSRRSHLGRDISDELLLDGQGEEGSGGTIGKGTNMMGTPRLTKREQELLLIWKMKEGN